ncbi:MAG: glycosyltransferase family 9 protein [Armatimonadetes bacterium]|nr:glycosyltransferase family 9 protein [Armatimonadota bacterium]
MRILILKLAAAGDVLRTTPVLPALKRSYPRSHITWVTESGGFELLKGIPSIDRLLAADLPTVVGLGAERFDRLYCFDKDPLATGLAMTVPAEVKRGFGRNPGGALIPLHPSSHYAYELGLDDELKFRGNQKTYPRIVFEMAELEYAGDEYQFVLTPEEQAFAREFAARHQLGTGQRLIGINTGCGPVFQMKKWTVEHILGFIELAGALDVRILLYGGPMEAERNRIIVERAACPVVDMGCHNTLRQFASLIDLCDVLVTGDTMPLHLGVALKKQVILLIGSTSWTEIDLYGRGVKLVSDLPCAPCYKRVCDFDPWCLQLITPEQVFQALQGCLSVGVSQP